jgi:hypothetical protein
LYNYKVINKTNYDFPVRFEMIEPAGEIRKVGDLTMVNKQEVLEGAMFVILDKTQLDGVKTPIKVGIYKGDELLETAKTNFMGPAN